MSDLIEKIEYFPDTLTAKRKYFIDEQNLKQGKSIEYYRDGSIMYETNFKDNKEDGHIFVYEKNGSIKYSGSHKEGKRHGVWEYPNKNKFYINGKDCEENDWKTYLIKTRIII